MEHIRPLMLSNHYLTFIRNQVESIAPLVGSCECVIRRNLLFVAMRSIGVKGSGILEYDYSLTSPSNVRVHACNVFYLPTDAFYKLLGVHHHRRAQKLISERNIDFNIIHSHFTWTPGYVGLRLKRKTGVPHIITAHGYDVYNLPFKNHSWGDKIIEVLESADTIITVSESNKKYIDRLGINQPVEVIPNGFSPALFYQKDQLECRKKLGISREKKIILCIGNLVPIKNHSTLIEAMSLVYLERKDVICYIIGSGRMETSLRRQIKSLNLTGVIHLAGGRPHEEIVDWINACDLFVLPSIMEGNPTVMFECLGCGRPFIGSNVGGIPEIIHSTDYGFLSDSGDSEDLSKRILEGLDKEWDYDAILRYSKKYTWDRIAKEIVKIYSSILE